jgi:hypothetical protein
VRSTDRVAAKVDPFTIPGVIKEPRKKEETDQDSKSSKSSTLSEYNTCKWRPDRHNVEELQYVCKNRIFKNPATKQYESMCCYHMKLCWMPVSR